MAGKSDGVEAAGKDAMNQYNVVWTTPSEDPHGSMPLGNGDVGVNVWVEPSGEIVFYISKTDAWDENGRLCKIGRVRVIFDPPLPVTNGFRQELKLSEGAMEIQAGQSRLKLWVDANRPVVRLEAESGQPVSCRAAVELWRLCERPFGKDDDSFSGRGLLASSFKPTVLPDIVVTSAAPRVVWYHRNTRSIYPLCLRIQHLEELADRFPDPLLNHTFGASLAGKGFVRDGAQGLRSLVPAKRHDLSVTVLAAKTETPAAWQAQLEGLEKSSSSSWEAHVKWWSAFWDRSWIFLSGTPEAETVTRGYVLQRFMNACAGRGGSPIKFNGSIFTVEAKPGASPETPEGDPDWRKWGGNYWFQNTRLAYWPMLEAGDFDLMDAWFRMYRDALPLSQARVETYYKFKNAAQFPETMYGWGLPNNGDYGWTNTAPEPSNSFISRYWNGSLELIAVMLDRYDFTQDEKFARDTLVPLADALISFLDQYWPKRDANGKIVFDPAQSLETWHGAVNPMPEIAGLRFLLPRLLELTATSEQKARWKKMLEELPPIPVKDGLLQPAETFAKKKNSENPALYAVFPYRLYGVGKPDLDMARATYQARGHRHNKGWCQDSIQAACLGLGDEAGRLVSARAAKRNEAHRFPAMWGPNFDWTPDQDHGNNILTTLQLMLLQYEGDKIFVLPAWPKDWDCDFRLHAPHATVIEGRVENGKVSDLKVTPESRRKDVVIGAE
jgi:hypothetical protein